MVERGVRRGQPQLVFLHAGFFPNQAGACPFTVSASIDGGRMTGIYAGLGSECSEISGTFEASRQ